MDDNMMDDYNAMYYIYDNQLWVSINGQGHLPVDPNKLVAELYGVIAELIERIAILEATPESTKDTEGEKS